MIPKSSLAAIRERMNIYGPKNCWTGTTGALAADINRLLAELERERKAAADFGEERAMLRLHCRDLMKQRDAAEARVAELQVELSRWHERGRPITER